MLRRQKAVELDDVELEHLDLGGNPRAKSRDCESVPRCARVPHGCWEIRRHGQVRQNEVMLSRQKAVELDDVELDHLDLVEIQGWSPVT
jgi:hypothetical protein